MPLLPVPEYSPVFPFTIGHFQTIYPTLFRKRPTANPIRERIFTEDHDFLDIDWHFPDNSLSGQKLAVISHGLEGSSRMKNVLGMASILAQDGWDVLCLNFRGCSGEMNRLPRLYHSGVTDDLHTVLCHGLKQRNYRYAALLGFSMGGNQTLKYLGEAPEKVPAAVRAAAVFSVPVDLAGSSARMALFHNRIYMRHFMRGLHQKIRSKAEMFPEIYDTKGLSAIKTFAQFDDRYTGPVHGFKDAAEYYRQCSSRQFLNNIAIPTLLVQAADDPFLSPGCYPDEEAARNPHLFLEIPEYGGHVGFVGEYRSKNYWTEDRAVLFFKDIFEDSAQTESSSC
ncbi:MAG: alpha/beta fold hydrolase [Desulfopila sp.]|jgi:predicted alpha/beta-fold hydrolase|nr:alpha/beta fold hydrolase [Desulfopila sp.]